MLELLRSSIGGWTAKIFIGLLVLSFAVWGVSGTIFQGVGNNVVEVGETKVGLLDYRLSYDQRVNALSRQLNTRLSREQANAFGLEQSVLAQLVSGAVLDENARKMGLGLSEKELAKLIGDDPSFRDAAGNFSRSQLQLALRQIGMSEESYIRNRTSTVVRNQIIEGTSRGVEVPKAMLSAFAQFQNEKRTFDYVIVEDAVVTEAPVPTDDDIKKHYEANLTDYVAPEYRKIDLVKLEAEDIADEAAITAEEIKNEFEANKNQFLTPETRVIEQLVIGDPAKAEGYAERINAGETFEKIVEEDGKKLEDISLGELKKIDIPDNAIGDAAFGLELNKPSGIVKGIFGPVLLRVTKITPEITKDLEEVSDQIRKDLALTKAADELFDMHDRLEDERAAGDSLADAAKKIGLAVRTIESVDSRGQDIDRKAVENLPNQGRLLNEVFQVAAGVETDPIALSGNGFVWFDVLDVTTERQKPLDEVNDEVKIAWVAKRTNEIIADVAESIVKRVSDGETFADVASDVLPEDSLGQKGKILQSEELDRQGSHLELNNKAVQKGFSIAQGGIVFEDMGNGKFAVLSPSRVVTPTGNDTPENMETQLNTSFSNDLLNQFVSDLQSEEEVLVNQQAIETALSL